VLIEESGQCISKYEKLTTGVLHHEDNLNAKTVGLLLLSKVVREEK